MNQIIPIRQKIYSPILSKRLEIIYADQTASGEFVENIENDMKFNVIPYYGNTHSNSYCGKQMLSFIIDTNIYIRKIFNLCKSHEIIFTGNGSTQAINHLIHIMGFTRKPSESEYHKIKNDAKEKTNYCIINTPVEHNSNLIPWINLLDYKKKKVINDYAKMEEGKIILDKLKSQLKKYEKICKTIILSIQAASNVTGIRQDLKSITKIVKSFKNVKLFVDFSASAPYDPMDLRDIDAAFMSGHKFLGVAPVGLLILKTKLVYNKIPFLPGGGTVKFVSNKFYQYSSNIADREYGGTPDIIGIIKFGRVLALKQQYQNYIIEREKKIIDQANHRFLQMRHLRVLGPTKTLNRLSIYALYFPNMHYNLVVTLLSDLYGIQVRGGVNCTSMYKQLLHISDKEIEKIYKTMNDKKMGIPETIGWVRVSLAWYLSDNSLKYILDAIDGISGDYNKYKRHYKFNKHINRWVNIQQLPFKKLNWLS